MNLDTVDRHARRRQKRTKAQVIAGIEKRPKEETNPAEIAYLQNMLSYYRRG